MLSLFFLWKISQWVEFMKVLTICGQESSINFYSWIIGFLKISKSKVGYCWWRMNGNNRQVTGKQWSNWPEYMQHVILFRTCISAWKHVLFITFSVWLHQHFSIGCCLNIKCLKIWHLKSPTYIKWQLFTNLVRVYQQARYTKLGSVGSRWGKFISTQEWNMPNYIHLQLLFVQFWMVLEDGTCD